MADFTMTPEIKELRTDVRAFMDEFLYPNEEVIEDASDDQAQDLIKDLQGRTKKMGYWAPHLPKEAGGMGIGFMPYVYMNEILGRSFLAPRAFGAQAPDSGNAEILWQFGSDDQKAKWLKPLVNGDIRSCFSMTEPEGPGSDPTTLQTQAVRDGDDWVINGSKLWNSGADTADYGIVYVRTDPEKGRQGITAFIVDTDTPGFRVERLVQVLRAHYTTELSFTDMRVPHNHILGEEGGGFALASGQLADNRIPYSSACIGVAVYANELAIDWAKQRVTFGEPLANRQAIQWMLVDNEIDIRTSRWIALDAAAKAQRGEPFRFESSMAKLICTEGAGRVVDRCMQIFGGLGMAKEMPLERWYRELRIRRVGEGPSEIQRIVMARDILNVRSGS